MYLPIKREVLNDFLAVCFKSSAKVMQWDSRKFGHGPIRNAARQATCEPSVFSFGAPPANDVEALVEFLNERGNLGGIVLPLAIHGHNYFDTGSVKYRFLFP